MDQLRFEALQRRVATLERRLWLALTALAVVAAALAVNVVAHMAYAQPASYTFSGYKGEVHFFKDAATGATCYVVGAGLACVR